MIFSASNRIPAIFILHHSISRDEGSRIRVLESKLDATPGEYRLKVHQMRRLFISVIPECYFRRCWPTTTDPAAFGLPGARKAIEILRGEIEITLKQIGCPNINGLGPQFLLHGGKAITPAREASAPQAD